MESRPNKFAEETSMKKSVSIADFGAVANSGLQTERIQAAIDHIFLQGGGEVTVPEGVFYTGGLRLRSRVTLHLLQGAILRGSTNPEDYFAYLHDEVEPLAPGQITDAPYVHLSTIHGETAYEDNKPEYRFKRIPGSRWNNALLRAIDAQDVAVIGEEGSELDGCNCFDAIGEELYRGPHLMTFFGCRNITLRGYTIRNSANWAHNMLYSRNISVENITVYAGHDGFDAAVCENITICNSEFYTGDDCIAGFGNTNVLVRGCELNSACSAFRFGGTNVLVEDCHMYGPCRYLFRGSLTKEEKKSMAMPALEGHRNNMLSAFTYYADYSVPIPQQPGNIILRNCRIDYADRFLHYNYSGNETWQKNRPLADITFENIQATDISMPLTAYGSPEVPLKLTMRNVEIGLREGSEKMQLLNICHYDQVRLENITLLNSQADALIHKWSDGEIRLVNVQCDIPEENRIRQAEEPFFARPI